MRTLRRHRDPAQKNRLTVAVAVEIGEDLPLPGEIAELDELGVVTVHAVRRTDSPEPNLPAGERVYVLDVESLETTGHVEDIG